MLVDLASSNALARDEDAASHDTILASGCQSTDHCEATRLPGRVNTSSVGGEGHRRPFTSIHARCPMPVPVPATWNLQLLGPPSRGGFLPVAELDTRFPATPVSQAYPGEEEGGLQAFACVVRAHPCPGVRGGLDWTPQVVLLRRRRGVSSRPSVCSTPLRAGRVRWGSRRDVRQSKQMRAPGWWVFSSRCAGGRGQAVSCRLEDGRVLRLPGVRIAPRTHSGQRSFKSRSE
ncbi:hypothetical protein PYCCODRAFT_1079208 [Trametes coccinea BRFM310]|uniref:Uncharacterized protein n=1 Tax=Trametes coccinea (strain BRFM310) TaxID=1353009 RepID=A0A1Y2IZV4_TRAC3|nr:hypothetical protein PYCCODRAFT_1079208 [Trametes coccinea BRFM310]